MFKNKPYIKTVILICLVSLVFFGLFICYEYVRLNIENNIIASLITNCTQATTIDEIIQCLNDKQDIRQLLYDYGIAYNEPIIIQLESLYRLDCVVFLCLFVIYIIVIFVVLYVDYIQRKKKIELIRSYIQAVNEQDYSVDLLDMKEDELSSLKNELYKITKHLKEESNHSKRDKLLLKDSLSDISHQIKTPLTSMTIMIDNIIENDHMTELDKRRFMLKMKREITSLKFLIYALLKLSRFDANVVVFNEENINVKDLVCKAKENLEVLSDLLDVSICINNDEDIYFKGDYSWQCEAITNIIKNCLEYSNEGSHIDIMYEQGLFYTKIEIKDYGKGMDEEDIKHIFERFYKGKNSSTDSVGIGLALAKSIVEKDNGTISVESKINQGTVFTIKYMKKI